MRIALVLTAVLSCAPVHAMTVEVYLAPGFNATLLGPSLPGGATTSTITAIAPNGDVWMSNGQTLFKLDGMGGVAYSESVLQANGGPVANNSVTSDLVFDSAGNFYINDFDRDIIYRRDAGGSTWEQIGTADQIRDMKFNSSGVLTIAGGALSGDVGYLATVSGGAVTQYASGLVGIESFKFDALGNVVYVGRHGQGVYSVNASGVVTELHGQVLAPGGGSVESIEITTGGNYILGINTGAFPSTGYQNTSKIIRLDGVTFEEELIGTNVGSAIPVDLQFADGDELIISGFGSLLPLGVTGDFDAPLIPTPSAFAAGVVCLGLMALRRNRASSRSDRLPTR